MIDPESFKEVFGGTDEDIKEFIQRANGVESDEESNKTDSRPKRSINAD